MALSLFKVLKGLNVSNTAGTESVDFLFGNGVPGLSAETNASEKGSVYVDNTTTGVFQKILAGSGADKWSQMATQDFVDSKVTNVSWREPAKLLDPTAYADVIAAQAAANVGNTLDGITIASGDRILLTNMTVRGDNIYIVSGSSGAWVFTEDTNLASSGDSTFIDQGTEAGKVFNYNGTAWVQINASDSTEAGFIRAFIGKSASGLEATNYTSNNVITDGDNLQAAIGKLDGALGADVTSSNFITPQDINLNLDALDQELGANVSNGNAILAANSINGNLTALDGAISSALPSSNAVNVTTITVIDSVLVDSVKLAKWIIRIEKVSAPVNNKSLELLATHDGTPSSDASNTDSTQYAVLKLGTAIAGLVIDVVLSGVGAAQVMSLVVTSTDAVDVDAKRISV